MKRKYEYYILSTPDDFYLADAICRELEKAGKCCYYNIRDSKRKDKAADSFFNFASPTICIGVVNDDFLSHDMLKANIDTFCGKSALGLHVCLLQNGPITNFPPKWQKAVLLDASKGLTPGLMSVIKGEENLQNIPDSQVADPSLINISNKSSEASSEESILQRIDNITSIDDITASENDALTLQRSVKYLRGEGVPQDNERAFTLMKKAASENPEDGKLQYYLGIFHELECGGGSKDEARDAYEKAIEKGYQLALPLLAFISYREKSQNNSEARDYFTKLLDEKQVIGAFGLGLLDEADGHYEEAIEHYSEAAELGNSFAQNALGCLYAEGKGVKCDISKAVQWFALAADQGLSQALYNCGMFLLAEDEEEAQASGEEMMREAAAKNNEAAIEFLHQLEVAKKKEETKRTERSRRKDNNDDDNEGGDALGAFLRGLGLGDLAGYAKSRLWDGN